MNKHKAALDHALAALSDGSGHEVWGPGVIGHKLWMANETLAARAFDGASTTMVRDIGNHTISKLDRQKFIAGMRKLAPVLLDILLEEA